jgi:hypothetical protein
MGVAREGFFRDAATVVREQVQAVMGLPGRSLAVLRRGCTSTSYSSTSLEVWLVKSTDHPLTKRCQVRSSVHVASRTVHALSVAWQLMSWLPRTQGTERWPPRPLSSKNKKFWIGHWQESHAHVR